ncbi:hypothetical protein P7C71_g1598, partial [Lecanoromycetidae sp. Uapishka_2]
MYLLYKRLKRSHSKKGAVPLLDEPETEQSIENKISKDHHGPFQISRVFWDSKAKSYWYTIKSHEGPNGNEILDPDTQKGFWVREASIRSVVDVEEEERNGGVVFKVGEESEEKMVRSWLESESSSMTSSKKVMQAKKELLIMDKLNGAGIYP